MSERWILRSKLSPPSPPTGWMRRRTSGPTAPVTLLVGGPGDGKTLALLGLHAEAQAAGRPAVWYSLDALDADPATFFHHLLVGVRAHLPAFGETVRAMLGGERLEPRLLWQAFFDSLAACRLEGLLLAFDDFQELATHQPELAQALGYFFDKLPPGVHLAIASRRRWPGGVSRLVAKGAVRVIDPALLRFSPDEVEAYLAMQAPTDGMPAAWREAARRLDGWPLGLALATSAGGAHTSPLREYVSEELYQAQPAALRDFMLQSALLDEITPEGCREVFDVPEAAERLEALAESHLLTPLADGEAYRFPTYLQEFLRSELERAVPRARRAGWHARAAAFHVARGRADRAVPHLVAAEDWPAVQSACDAIFPAMRFDGRQPQIRRWLAAFPPAVAEASPWWTLWHAHTLAHAGQSGEALSAYARARDRLAASSDAAGAFKALVGQCNAALTLQHEDAFQDLLAHALGHQGDRHAEDEVDLWLIRAYEAERRGDMAGMRACNEAALEVPIAGHVGVAASHCIALINLTTHTLYQGDVAQARRWIAQAIATAAHWSFDGYRLGALFLQSHLQVLVGDHAGASTFLAALPPLWEEALDWHDVAIAHTVLGAWHLSRAEAEAAEAALERSLLLFEQAGFKEGRLVPLEQLATLAIRRGQVARAEALAAEAAEGASLHHWALALPRARAMHLGDRAAEALAVLTAARTGLDALGANLLLTRARLYEAAALLKLGRPAEAAEAHAAATALIDAHGYGFLRAQDAELWEELSALTPKESRVPGLLTFELFGPFVVRRGGEVLDQWPRRKARVLLAALALHPEGLRADELAELVGHGEANPANVLRVNAWALRRALEPALGRGDTSRYVVVSGDRYRLAPELVGESDLVAVEADLAAADAAMADDPREAARLIERAVGLVKGGLLDEGGPFEVFEPRREAFRRRMVTALHALAAHYRRNADYARAEVALERAIALAPCDEECYLAAMRLHRALGRDERVRRAYWDCRQALKTHQGLAPSDAFEAAYRALLAGSVKKS